MSLCITCSNFNENDVFKIDRLRCFRNYLFRRLDGVHQSVSFACRGYCVRTILPSSEELRSEGRGAGLIGGSDV